MKINSSIKKNNLKRGTYTLKGSFGSEVNVILKVTFADLKVDLRKLSTKENQLNLVNLIKNLNLKNCIKKCKTSILSLGQS